MSSLSDSSLSEEISLNDSIDFLKIPESAPNALFKPNFERASNISQEERTSSTLSSKFFLIIYFS